MSRTALDYTEPGVLADSGRDRSNLVAFVVAVLLFAACAIYCAFKSASDIEDDAVTHYMIARWALEDHIHLVSVWGRPLCTLCYVIPAVLGKQVGVRLMSLVLALIIALVTYRIAVRQKMKYPALAVVLLLAQPLFFLHAWSSLTEIPFAVFLTLAFWAYQRRNFFWMAVLISVTPLGRPEGFGFVLIAAFALILHRKWWWLVILPLPFLAWNYAGWVVIHRPPDCPWWDWVRRNWPYGGGASMYKKGWLLSYVGRLPALVGAFAFPFVVLGIWISFRVAWRAAGFQPLNPGKGNSITTHVGIKDQAWANTGPVFLRPFRWVLVPGNHLARCAMWIAMIPLMMLVVHSLLHWTGKMSSSGELRYLVIVAPFWALLGAQGIEWFAARYRFAHTFRWVAVGSLLPLLANWHAFPGRPEVPFPRYANDFIATAATDWYRADSKLQADYPRIVATPTGIWLHLDISLNNIGRAGMPGKIGARSPLPGTILFWDATNGNYNSNPENTMPKDEMAKGHWVYVGRFDCSENWIEVYLSPTNIRDEPTIWNKPPLMIDACPE